MLTADEDISGRAPNPIGVIERNAKYVVGKEFLDYKWVWHRLGQRALSPQLHFYDEQSTDPHELTIMDGLGLFATQAALSSEQGLKSYPHSGEREWETTLASWGLAPELADDGSADITAKFVFGTATTEPVFQTTMKGQVITAAEAILSKTDAQVYIPLAHAQLEVIR